MEEENNNAAKGAADKVDAVAAKHADKLPKLSAENKALASKFMPWGVGVFGLFALLWANDLRDAANGIGSLDALGEFSEFLSIALPSSTELWIGAGLFAAIAVLIILAFTKGLFRNTSNGHQFASYAMLAAIVSGLYFIFILSELDSSRGWIVLVIGLVGYYALHQTSDSYNK